MASDKPAAVAITYGMNIEQIRALVFSAYALARSGFVYVMGFIDMKHRETAGANIVCAIMAAREVMGMPSMSGDAIENIILYLLDCVEKSPKDVSCIRVPIKTHRDDHIETRATAEAEKHVYESRGWHILNPDDVPACMRSKID